jgi:hypothetical protein
MKIKKLLIQDLTMLMLILLNSVGIYNYERDIKVGKYKVKKDNLIKLLLFVKRGK